MATWLVWAVTLAYLGTAIDLYIKQDMGHSLMFFGYAIANLGIVRALERT